MVGKFQSQIELLAIGLLMLCTGCRQSTDIRSVTSPYRLSDTIKSQLQNGDIILRKGDGILSEFISMHLADTLDVSHCGILYRNSNQLDVIHCLSKDVSDIDGVQCCSLDHFTEESVKGSIIIVRFKADTAGIIAPQALYYLHTHKPFDRQFNAKDSSAFFCSEFPLHIIKYYLHTDLYPVLFQSPRFSLFLNPKYFDLIYADNSSLSH